MAPEARSMNANRAVVDGYGDEAFLRGILSPRIGTLSHSGTSVEHRAVNRFALL
jgi:hypothetical protein